MALRQDLVYSTNDAAEIDGAHIFQQIRHITIPLLTPTFILLVIFSLGGILKGQFGRGRRETRSKLRYPE